MFSSVIIIILILTIIMALVVSLRFTTYQSFIQPNITTVEARFDHYIERWFQSDHQCTQYDIAMLQTKHPNEFKDLVVTFNKIEEYITASNKSNIKYNYLHDLYSIWKQLPTGYKTDDKKIVWYPYDRVERFEFPILVKTRWYLNPALCPGPPSYCARGGSILFKLNQARHFETMNKLLHEGDPLAFEEKKKRVVWRGNSTGYGFGNNIPIRPQSRETLIKKYAKLPSSHPIDVGLVKAPEEYKKYQKKFMTIPELLENRYLISVEGNDVATNLKWIMASNSIVMMPKPRIESWYLESQLIPYVHYIPLKDDFSDIQEQYLRAEQNPSMCKSILRHAKEYARQYIQSTEIELQCKILMYYIDHFLWT